MSIGAGPPWWFVETLENGCCCCNLLKAVAVLSPVAFHHDVTVPQHGSVWLLRWGEGVVVVDQLFRSSRWQSWLGLVVVLCCLVRICWVQTPSWRMTPRSCWCRMSASVAWWGSLCFLFQQVLKTCRKVVGRFRGQFPVDAVCILLLLVLSWCWSGRALGFGPVVPIFLLLPVSLPLLIGLLLSGVVVLSRLCRASLGRMDLADPCALQTCISSLRMLSSCRHMLVACLSLRMDASWSSGSSGVCVLVACHLPFCWVWFRIKASLAVACFVVTAAAVSCCVLFALEMPAGTAPLPCKVEWQLKMLLDCCTVSWGCCFACMRTLLISLTACRLKGPVEPSTHTQTGDF